MAQLLFASDHDINNSPIWRVERQPGQTTNPYLVRFVKSGRNGRLLDQIALWSTAGWDQSRWMPKPPIVPKWLIAKVEAHMRKVQP